MCTQITHVFLSLSKNIKLLYVRSLCPAMYISFVHTIIRANMNSDAQVITCWDVTTMFTHIKFLAIITGCYS